MKRLHVLGALLAALTLASFSATASAAPTDPFQYKFQFNTAAIPGYQAMQDMEVNHQNGNVLILERGQVDQFDASGNPVDFSGLGSPTFVVGGGQRLFVDNTGGPTQGNIFVLDLAGCCGYGEKFWSFGPDGKPISSGAVNVSEKVGAPVFAGSIRSDGNFQVMLSPFGSNEKWTTVWTPAGTQVGKKAIFDDEYFGGTRVFDDLGHAYAPFGSTFQRYKQEPSGTYTPEGDTGLPTEAGYFGPGPFGIEPLNQDPLERFQTGGLLSGSIRGVHYTDPLVSQTPYTLIDGIEPWGEPFDLDATGQYLYVGEGNSILRAYHREPTVAPVQIGPLAVDGIRSSRVAVHGVLDTKNANTTFYFEYGLDTSYGQVTASQVVPRRFQPKAIDGALVGLQPDTVYHLRMVMTNSAGTTKGPDRVIRTYPISAGGADDQCPNALARKQTSAQRLPDCRAYELVSAVDTAGYDVESYLVPGQEPFPGFPAAVDRLLYATHAGAVPGPWNATNKGRDPYLASRTANGWVTDYKGLPANLTAASGAFASVLGEADSALDTFAFAGAELCSPCFTSGLEVGLPVRLPSGQVVQGMAGSLDPGNASAKPEGKVAKFLSADGGDLIFASKYAFEPGANTDGTSLTVYKRDLSTATTRIVSTDQNGAVLSGPGISELDLSTDGSRVVVGKNVSTDSQGNEYVHPYMHIGNAPNSVDLAPGSTSGVLYAGMTADGSAAYFTSVDKLLAGDEDTSADLYRAAVGPSGALDLSLVTGNSTVACNPVANGNGSHWNTTGAAANCDTVAVGGGGGVAGSAGSVYFLSPERFGGLGTTDQPNLYAAAPGAAPQLVATLEPSNPLVLNSVKSSAVRRSGDFQVTPGGSYAVFTSALPLTGTGNFGLRSVFRYAAGDGQLTCPSCDTTGSADGSLASNTALAPSGLSVLEDGRVFFTTSYPLVLNDANGQADVYELTLGGKQELVSSGTGSFDAGLLTASAGGSDVFFFTHDTLAPEEDRNGQLMKIYDARVGGGFFKLPPAVPCKASDECHGPSSPTPAPADIKSSGKTTVGNVVFCPKSKVKHRNKCVKRPAKHKKKKTNRKKSRKAGKAQEKKGGRHA
jgi:hypothetical protein